MERTLIILKPDAVGRSLIGRILSRIEDKGLRITGLKMLNVTLPLARRMYQEHRGKEFYQRLVDFMISGPVVAVAVEGLDAIAVVRKMIGPTFGPDAPGGTIRGDFGMSRRYNLVHASDSPKAARRELSLFFARRDYVKYPAGAPALELIYDLRELGQATAARA